ncbi:MULTISPECIES: helix-turn-helix transcriptional regulator [Clostridia]|uniref:helix-turn-helix domain-containing protein n=1 Tax=Clostridia TaxID=186801 RepID=UPI0018F3BC82|nr:MULTISPECIES: helix-turn-helix transcriptional regulator [Clostridia]
MEQQANYFGEKLKKCRKKRGWSQEKLANELHASRQAVYKWEANKGYPDIQNLIRISDLFGITIDELIRGDKKCRRR